jgi:hypothetical protein
VKLTVVAATQWYRELVTDPAAQRTRLDKPKVMGVRRRSAAHKTWLPGDELPVLLIARANRFAQRTDWLIARRFTGPCRSFLASARIRPTRWYHALAGDGNGRLARAYAIADCREPCLKLLLDNLGISCRKRVLGRKISMRPDGRIIGRMDGSQLRNQALPKAC